MDEFERRDADNNKIYDTLLLEDIFRIRYRKHSYLISLFIQRMPCDIEYIDSSLTFTAMKNELADRSHYIEKRKNFKVLNEVFTGIYKIKYPINEKVGIDYFFDKPVKFNAQNSSNKSGYGSRYCGEDLIYEGTLYGETTDYMFVGAKYSFWY